MTFKPWYNRAPILILVVFVANKFLMRPWVVESGGPAVALVFVGSLPNLLEGIFGTLILAGIALEGRRRLPRVLGRAPDGALHLLAGALAGVYVVTQEFGIHQLGGGSVFDPWDVVASVVGVGATTWALFRWSPVVAEG